MATEAQTRVDHTFYVDDDGYDAIDKDPDEVLDYQIDWSSNLDSGDTISTSTFTAATGLTKDSESNTTTASTVWLSGGTFGKSYLVTCRIVTAQARTKERVFRVHVKE